MYTLDANREAITRNTIGKKIQKEADESKIAVQMCNQTLNIIKT